MDIYNTLIQLEKEIDICIEGECGKCNYYFKSCTDSLIDKCSQVVKDLIKEYERTRDIPNSTIYEDNQ